MRNICFDSHDEGVFVVTVVESHQNLALTPQSSCPQTVHAIYHAPGRPLYHYRR
jgi:hypothetical protein